MDIKLTHFYSQVVSQNHQSGHRAASNRIGIVCLPLRESGLLIIIIEMFYLVVKFVIIGLSHMLELDIRCWMPDDFRALEY